MGFLEYRRLDEEQGYPVLYTYDGIGLLEIAARFACDRFIKDGIVYEKTSSAIEPVTSVIYVQEAGKADPGDKTPPALHGVRVELRQDWEGEPPGLLLQAFDFSDGAEVVLHLLCDYWFWLGEEWLRTLTVLDEDRKVYVYYAKRAV